MTIQERDALAAICLLAAFADGDPDEQERARLKAIADQLGTDGQISTEVYQRVIFKQTDAAKEAAVLSTPELKRQAFDMALGVCDADGSSSPAEKQFLSALAANLGIPADEAKQAIEQVDLLASDPLDAGPAVAGVAGAAGAAGVATAITPSTAQPNALDKELDGSILNYSILNGALELLPQGLASAAIIPIQMKMVYAIGKKHGYTLDRGHIKDFFATAGVGVASQVVEGFARKLVGGLIENVGGRFIGKGLAKSISGWGQTATGAAFTFASTYALGQVAKQYYAGGRKMSAIDIKTLFTSQTASAQQMYEQYRPRIEEQARKVNPTQILSMIRGG